MQTIRMDAHIAAGEDQKGRINMILGLLYNYINPKILQIKDRQTLQTNSR